MSSDKKGMLFCLGCISFIPGLKNQLVNSMSFYPPAIKGYKYSKNSNSIMLYDHQRNKYITLNEMLRNLMNVDPGRRLIKTKFLRINSTDLFYYINPRSNLTIIYSHSNATDIGYLFGHLLDLSYRANVNIISYEYNGYGQSKSKPSEESMYENIKKVVNYSIKNLNIPENSLILYGQSIGSAPTIHFASTHNKIKIGGVIVHSGIKSAVSVICNSNSDSALPWYDAFKNLDKIKNVKCPVFIIHGTHDTIIPCNHGEMLYKSAPNKYTPWFVNGANHCNIELNWRRELIMRIRGFLAYISPSEIKKPISSCEHISMSRISTLSSQGFEKLSIDGDDDDDDDNDICDIQENDYDENSEEIETNTHTDYSKNYHKYNKKLQYCQDEKNDVNGNFINNNGITENLYDEVQKSESNNDIIYGISITSEKCDDLYEHTLEKKVHVTERRNCGKNEMQLSSSTRKVKFFNKLFN